MSYDRRTSRSWVRESSFRVEAPLISKMFKYLLCAVTALAAVQASGDFVVLHSPESVKFQGNEEVQQSQIKEICTAAMGFTVKQRSTWSGMSINDPFNLPEAVVGVAVEGVGSLKFPTGQRFSLAVDEAEETTWQAIRSRIEERDYANTLVRFYLADGVDALGHSALGELKPDPIDESSLKALSLENNEDRELLDEIQLMLAIAKDVPTAITADSKSDVFWFVISGLRPVLDLHGEDSAAGTEARALLFEAVNALSKAFMNVYKDKVLITAFTNDASLVRNTRSINLERQTRDTMTEKSNHKSVETAPEVKRTPNATELSEKKKLNKNNDSGDTRMKHQVIDEINVDNETEAPPLEVHSESSSGQTENPHLRKPEDELNLSKEYGANYPVIFNIMLWFGVAFVFSLIAICIAIADMDPGRDSIIYRMTSTRMKKDN